MLNLTDYTHIQYPKIFIGTTDCISNIISDCISNIISDCISNIISDCISNIISDCILPILHSICKYSGERRGRVLGFKSPSEDNFSGKKLQP